MATKTAAQQIAKMYLDLANSSAACWEEQNTAGRSWLQGRLKGVEYALREACSLSGEWELAAETMAAAQERIAH